jgi:mono/diheme cytochrome c family protein
MKAFLGALACICGFIIVALSAFIWSGIYNIAADVPHWGVTFWILDQARIRSVAFHSRGINPPPLNDKTLVHKAFPYFHETCRHCHGAPGQERNSFAQGLYPNPPPLTLDDVHKGLGDAEMFWVVKNGFKMTGMPAFEKIHTDNQIWAIIAFVRNLPNIYPSDYDAMLKAWRKGKEAGQSGQP